jgi:hypothetical protein
MDFFFFVDIIINFNTAYYDEYYKIEDKRGVIAKGYITGFFIIDLLSIIPFDVIFASLHFNGLARFSKIGRMYKLVRITRLLKLFKILKEQSRIHKILTDYLRIGLGMERLIFFTFLTIIAIHICACLWIIFPRIIETDGEVDNFKGTWLENYTEYSKTDLYAISLYWCITTITTVGYGDILPVTVIEKLFTSILMIVGVVGFSFVTSAMTSILSNLDATHSKTKF